MAGEEIFAGELRVLRYRQANLSRCGIGAGLPVPVNVVSAHVRGCYAGLGVSERC